MVVLATVLNVMGVVVRKITTKQTQLRTQENLMTRRLEASAKHVQKPTIVHGVIIGM